MTFAGCDSITSSATARIAGGTVMPSIFAVLRSRASARQEDLGTSLAKIAAARVDGLVVTDDPMNEPLGHEAPLADRSAASTKRGHSLSAVSATRRGI
jgi:hypothetical protein